MSEGIEVIGIYVRDQDEALAFYVDRLGFRVQADVRNGDYRWLTVQHPEQPTLQLGLCRPGPPVPTRTRGPRIPAMTRAPGHLCRAPGLPLLPARPGRWTGSLPPTTGKTARCRCPTAARRRRG